jgi:hypothetical protein
VGVWVRMWVRGLVGEWLGGWVVGRGCVGGWVNVLWGAYRVSCFQHCVLLATS